ncbi:hypothetical protein KFE25_007110 [Diacronema lutheri]|uniref:U6 small nuclear RNA (adenine-(43)-N(6))-methyltransferase n=2 Tax=Diacronema lutheri TaxID=2081491 RepID=A0A8J5XMZ4_DIALT|nr:hypothetical protein KFE25_007110 [Diacronema lutheri]
MAAVLVHAAALSSAFHPRNAFTGSYDMRALVAACPGLGAHVVPPEQSRSGRATINFADPSAVRALNRALLAADYGVRTWELPEGRLCPPVPSRADYIHHVADVLAEATTDSAPPTGPCIRGFDVGTGSSLIYPLLGAATFGWRFIASESDLASSESAERIRAANAESLPALRHSEVRFQPARAQLLAGVRALDEEVDFVMCNPPFYGSASEFKRENARKLHGLAASARRRGGAATPAGAGRAAGVGGGATAGSDNFGGAESELWCPGGEVAFVGTLAAESRAAADSVLWFSSIVSRAEHVARVRSALASHRASPALGGRSVAEVRTVLMGQGGKRTNLVFWSFKRPAERRAWAKRRGWAGHAPADRLGD